MTIQEVFISSNDALQKTVSQIKDDQWDLAMPPGMSAKPGNLKDAVLWHTYDDAWVPDVLDGKTIKEVGDKYKDLLTATDAQGNYSKYNKRANEAVGEFKDLDRVTHLSYGDFPAKEYLLHVVTFRVFRAYDIAKLIGADTTLPADLVQAVTDALTPVIEDFRKMGVFQPALPVPDSATTQEKLMAMVGRK